jgi:hypothetical protein
MGLRALIQAMMGIALLAAATGQLPKIVHAVRMAQLELIQDSKASRWGRAMLLPSNDHVK